MANRLRNTRRAKPGFFLFFFWFLLAGWLPAQPGFFNFNYPGPTHIPVDTTSCTKVLAGNIGTPIVTSTVGANIVLSQFDPVASGFNLNAPWNFGETAQLFWNVADDQGRTAQFSFFVFFIDTTKPRIITSGTPPAVTYASIRLVPPPPNLGAADPCGNPTVTFTESPRPPLCQAGTFTRTWLATDMSGNTGVFTQTITILIDTLPPTVTSSPQNGSAPCTQVNTAYPTWLATQMANFKATDPSGVASYTNNAPPALSGNCPPPLTVIFTATDSCGFSVTRTATFTSIDNKGPDILRAPQDSIVACSPPANNHLAALAHWIHHRAGLAVRDSCTPEAAIQYSTQIGGTPVDSAQITAAFVASLGSGCGPRQIGNQTYDRVRGWVTVDFFARDACNNITYVGQATFAARDTVPPKLTGNSVTEECGGGNDQTALNAWINAHGNISVSDDCSNYTWTDFSWTTSTGQSGSGLFGSGPYPEVQPHNCSWFADITFRATDECGNTGARTLRFQITDTTPPAFAPIPNDTLYCPDTALLAPKAFVSDNCDTALVFARAQTITALTCPGNYTLLVTWTVTDDCGNTATATQTVVVRDTTRPVITLRPADRVIRCDTFALPPNPLLGAGLQATDICGAVVSLTVSDASNRDPNPTKCGHYTYAIVRTFLVSDDCGNTASAQQIIQVLDNIPPTLFGFTDTTLVCEVSPITPPPTAADVCNGIASAPVLVNEVIDNPGCGDTYTKLLTWQSTDVCGNVGQLVQTVHIVDTVAPVLIGVPAHVTVECKNIPPLPAPGAITANDNCDETPEISFSETELRDPNPNSCAYVTNYQIRRQWVVEDNCDNRRTYVQIISVKDQKPPIVTALDTLRLNTAPGLCQAPVTIPALLSVYDECTASALQANLRDTMLLTPSGTPIDQKPVNPVAFNWPAPNVPPQSPALSAGALTISLDRADAEQASEFLYVYGEGGLLLGRTKNTDVSCGFSDTTFTIPVTLLNNWLSDGQITITLTPNGTGPDAINAFCSGGRVRARLTYTYGAPERPVSVAFAVNGGTFQPFPPAGPVNLQAGTHTVTYRITDCAGNSTSALTIVKISDTQPPSITAPAPLTAFVGPSNCVAAVTLPFPALSENCAFDAFLDKSSGAQAVVFQNDANAGWVPQNTSLTISGLLANAVSGGTVVVRHRGDNGQAGEFFYVLSENGDTLGTTTLASGGECVGVHETTFSVSAAQINAWAADGTASFSLRANRDVVNYSDHINPCGPLNAAHRDGISTLEVVLRYNYAVVNYRISKGAQTVLQGQLQGSSTTVSLPPGNYTATYTVSDASGNTASTSYAITVRDTVPPTALCQPITIFTNPHGSVTYVLQPQEVDNGSADNCSGTILNRSVSPTNFTCNMAGNVYPVTLTVTDTSGNSASCQASVRVEMVAPQPTVTSGVCEGGPVQFFANPPAPTTGYTYKWSGPSGFVSMQANPIIPATSSANQGTYVVEITGPTGCKVSGSVFLNLTNLPTQPILQMPSLICEGTTLTLQTQPFAGTTVVYSWFRGTPGNAILVGTTSVPIFQIPNPPPGVYPYYVRVSADGCLSLPSEVKEVTVQARPVAQISPAGISVCACEAVSLHTPIQGSGITYSWSGPAGFSSALQSPLVTSCAQGVHAGTYTLVISANGCASLPATASVEVRPKPAKPQIGGNGAVCAGNPLTLVCNNVPNATEYRWFSPQAVLTTTSVNTLVIPSASIPAHAGEWRLQVVQNGCVSDLSEKYVVQIENFPDLSATSNSPICQGNTLTLSASSTTQGVAFTWTGPNGFSAIGAQASTNTPTTGTYTVVVSTPNSCTNSAAVAVNVIVPPLITSVTHTAPSCVTCNTDAVLQATIFTQNPPLTYQWTGPGGFFSTALSPVIPNVCTSNNGTYTLVVRDSANCPSAPASTVVSVIKQPERPLLSAPTSLCVGSPLTIAVQNANAYGSGVLFDWSTPYGVVTQSQANLVISSAGMQHSGTYRVTARIGNCASAPSEEITVQVHPIPLAPTVSSNSPVCEGDTLRLSAQMVPGGQYSWTGPSGFTASTRDPIIEQVNKATHEGCYFATVSVNGCTSPPSQGACVLIRTRPSAPLPLPMTPACLSQAGATLTFRIAPATATPGAQYVWFNAATQAPLGPPTFALNFTLTDLTGLKPGANNFYVRSVLDGCASAPSTPAVVHLDTIPAGVNAFAGLDFNACDVTPVQLKAAVPPTGVSGRWRQVSGLPVTIVNQPLPSTAVLGAAAGNVYGFEWVLSNGACQDFSRDTVQVTVNAFEKARVVKDLYTTCFADTVEIQAIPGQGVAGIWRQPLGQALFQPPIIIDNPNSPTTKVRNLPPNANTFFFYWILNVAGCPADTAFVTVYTINKQPFAGQDQNLCITDSCTLLQATPLDPFETGKWTYLDAGANPKLTLNAPNAPSTIACGLRIGPNRFVWETNGGLCGERSRDTLVVSYDLEPTANEDTITVPYGQQVLVNVLRNDIVPPQFTVRVLEPPKQGQWSEPSKGVFTYLPNLTFTGRDKLIYELCNLNPACPCSMATLFFEVEAADSCRIPTVITPNGDGVNDAFVIPFYCLAGGEGGSQNEVSIFNQWGDRVFYASPYNNDWEGTYNGQPLPAGTYFFVVKLPGEDKPRTGFLIIQR
ncbi:MAG: gliding motility-associated C-terminal domain-containing protein [Saprospiraceae bacterium]|nr:gliding motility-associated C-terminal domain-containing protein [Saprospiraceae bacterium]MDW8230058.1 gliding motility-associated C-terminal domain-containing protein [Saprospiraceae bacterium]